jgi:hypothetical protein
MPHRIHLVLALGQEKSCADLALGLRSGREQCGGGRTRRPPLAQGVKGGQAEAHEDDGPGALEESPRAEGEGAVMELPPSALEAVAIEHERDHGDGPGWPQDGCNGCRLLSLAFSLRADLRAVAVALEVIVERALKTTGAFHPEGPTVQRARAALARPGVQATLKP